MYRLVSPSVITREKSLAFSRETASTVLRTRNCWLRKRKGMVPGTATVASPTTRNACADERKAQALFFTAVRLPPAANPCSTCKRMNDNGFFQHHFFQNVPGAGKVKQGREAASLRKRRPPPDSPACRRGSERQASLPGKIRPGLKCNIHQNILSVKAVSSRVPKLSIKNCSTKSEPSSQALKALVTGIEAGKSGLSRNSFRKCLFFKARKISTVKKIAIFFLLFFWREL